MAAILQAIFTNALSWKKIIVFLFKFHWNMFPWVQISICQHWFTWWLGALYANRSQANIWTHIGLVYGRIYVSPSLNELTHWGQDKMAAILQMIFLFKFHYNMFPRVQLTINQHWFRYWIGADQATTHYQNRRWFIVFYWYMNHPDLMC